MFCVCFTVLLLELQTSQISNKIRELQKKEGTEGEHLQILDAIFSLSHLSSVCPRVPVRMSPMSMYVCDVCLQTGVYRCRVDLCPPMQTYEECC